MKHSLGLILEDERPTAYISKNRLHLYFWFVCNLHSILLIIKDSFQRLSVKYMPGAVYHLSILSYDLKDTKC